MNGAGPSLVVLLAILIVPWILFIYATGQVAAARGHDPLAWYLAAVFLGPAALLAALVAPYTPEIQAAALAEVLARSAQGPQPSASAPSAPSAPSAQRPAGLAPGSPGEVPRRSLLDGAAQRSAGRAEASAGATVPWTPSDDDDLGPWIVVESFAVWPYRGITVSMRLADGELLISGAAIGGAMSHGIPLSEVQLRAVEDGTLAVGAGWSARVATLRPAADQHVDEIIAVVSSRT